MTLLNRGGSNKRVLRLLALALAALLLSGCISVWREDVKIGDGSIIKVTRIEKYSSGGGIGESCYFCIFDWARLTFKYGGKRYWWKSVPMGATPMIIDVLGGNPVIVSTPVYRICPRRTDGKPGLAFYTYSKYRGDGWEVSSIKPNGILGTANLHPYKPSFGSGLSVSEKAAWINNAIATHKDKDPFSEIDENAVRNCQNGGRLQ